MSELSARGFVVKPWLESAASICACAHVSGSSVTTNRLAFRVFQPLLGLPPLKHLPTVAEARLDGLRVRLVAQLAALDAEDSNAADRLALLAGPGHLLSLPAKPLAEPAVPLAWPSSLRR
jgi:hypothetical protein